MLLFYSFEKKNPHSFCRGLAFLLLGDVVSNKWDLKGVANRADSGRPREWLTSGWCLPSESRFLQTQRWEIQLVGREDQGRGEVGPCGAPQSPQEDKGLSERGCGEPMTEAPGWGSWGVVRGA